MEFLLRLIREVHRRSLWQVLGVYLVGAWLAYQVILGLVEGLQLPPWLPGMAVVLFLIGLPIVIATAMVGERPGSTAPVTASGQAPAPGSGAPGPESPVRWLRWHTVLPAGVAAFAALAVAGVLLSAGGGREAGAVGPAGSAEDGGATGSVVVVSSPEGARFGVHPVVDGAKGAEFEAAGQSPGSLEGLPPGEYLVRVELEGHHAVSSLVRVAAGATTRLEPRLVRAAGRSAPMVHVTAGAPGVGGEAVGEFLMDRYEVTNARFSEFVAAGGYADARYWPERLWVGGELEPWATAVRRFVDRTGMPGPRSWSGGIPPAGRGDHPVVGVSWYEAAAYARWAGGELPGWSQWWRAALGDAAGYFPWGSDVAAVEARANFGMAGTAPVGSFPLGVSPFGAEDMAGNVREWLRDGSPTGPPHRRLVVGGGWLDPDYMFEPSKAEAFSPDHASDVIGFRIVITPPQP